jgi:HisA/HisF family protein
MTQFSIIPVLDLKAGAVVRAKAGERASYRPIETPLSPSSAPGDVLRGLFGLAPFRHVYIADLDAIGGTGDHGLTVRELARTAPGAEFWLDGGFAAASDAERMAGPGIVPVFGSETLASKAALADAVHEFGASRLVLSLDYRGGKFMGPAEIETRPELWPRRVILMTLDRVGMDNGPDVAALEALVRRAEGRAVFAAGGVRGDADIAALAAIGVAGALVATALHDGRISRPCLARHLG